MDRTTFQLATVQWSNWAASVFNRSSCLTIGRDCKDSVKARSNSRRFQTRLANGVDLFASQSGRRRMQSDDITPAQAEHIKAKVRPMLGYLGRLKHRMHKRRFPHDDLLFLTVVKAYDADPRAERARALPELRQWRRPRAAGNRVQGLAPATETMRRIFLRTDYSDQFGFDGAASGASLSRERTSSGSVQKSTGHNPYRRSQSYVRQRRVLRLHFLWSKPKFRLNPHPARLQFWLPRREHVLGPFIVHLRCVIGQYPKPILSHRA